MTAPSAFGDLVRVDVITLGSTVRLTVAGEVDSSSAPVLSRHLDEALDGPVGQLIVDLCGVSFLDSAGLCVLATAHRRATEQQTTLRVLASSRAVVRPLQITGLWRLLEAEEVDPEAVDRIVEQIVA
ncbi:STAS domain-containing protein [Candidatus Blastococcus massiliensis]|uniref:STAS domain-containing protein n=1 Tax=Candidatus Blastococcus massiliensis TaxID=1470358 RepID=UPI0004B299AA|nr:STAS domain-containing protein [Candidatus Blastococcus massiliensis]